ncbi:hypothetical protein GCM10017779_10960 [Streptomyces capillispiralis]|uniref:Helicase C-terminal domain-containing protein n=1 Tax=Streptomyces capillispiralis TaxID=68182 RepID=A0A561TIJ0_9ACTN|nr:hypothetical protein FHX78_113939 [Streptomyces capillispiralis]GHH90639.1 hypothetical protein GCM10017779_10960 [Streptomyces capillispiralis]
MTAPAAPVRFDEARTRAFDTAREVARRGFHVVLMRDALGRFSLSSTTGRSRRRPCDLVLLFGGNNEQTWMGYGDLFAAWHSLGQAAHINPEELLAWLQGSRKGRRPARVVAPDLPGTAGADRTGEAAPGAGTVVPTAPPPGDVELDYVGSVAGAAAVIAALYRGEKRLVFCESRRLVEELGARLRAKGVTTFLSHASLSVDERRRAETAFAEERDCVIVSTAHWNSASTWETSTG